MKSHYITDLAILIFTILITGLVNPSISAVIIPILIASYFLANWYVSKAEGKKISYRDAWLLSFFLSPLVAWFVIDSSPKKKAIIIFTSVVLFFSTGTYFVNSRTTNNSGISNSSSSKSLDTSTKAYRQGYSDGRTGYGQPASSTVSAADYYMSRGYNFSSADQLVYKMGYEDGLYGRTKRY